ncbi:flagellar basal body P-ring protein FlgI [Sphingosinicella sp. YJ22]|uniref:flagellar basal body P-ring protein FlgI n=1 Tax=Sphingosinicella sp. YJ22 TaxID=1104780 RepID=UPI001A9CB1E0|nr:flagellar basal body P-ring protein FlgI [Sphingosinicella sp. YJ22]
MFRTILLALVAAFAVAAPAQASRVKDLGSFQGVRTNQLTGYGIVVGLAGTGDDNLAYATQGMTGVASRFGLTLPPGVNPSLRNAAAVMITAELPPFANPGQRIDITVSALGRARSLRGGTLIMTPLRGADDQIYAMAQGNLVVGGLGVSAQDGSQVTVNVPSAGRIPGGATVERSVDTGFATAPQLRFNLFEADLTTAGRVAEAINREIGQPIASAVNGGSIAIDAPDGAEARTALMGRIENVLVDPGDAPARVIVNSRTGTVVINGAVRISPAAVSHGRLTVSVEENPQVIQPEPFSRGQTAVQQDSAIRVEEERARMFDMGAGANLSEIVRAVNAIGATASDLVAILEALKQAGALRAELVIL